MKTKLTETPKLNKLIDCINNVNLKNIINDKLIELKIDTSKLKLKYGFKNLIPFVNFISNLKKDYFEDEEYNENTHESLNEIILFSELIINKHVFSKYFGN